MYPSENYLIRNQTNYFKGVFIQNKSRDIFTIRFITISIENIFIVDIEFFFIFELLFGLINFSLFFCFLDIF